jgi:dihydropyrimidinase
LGITTLKVFMAYNGRLRLSDGEIFQVLRLAACNGMLTMLHAENGDVIETLIAEALAVGHTGTEWHALTRPAWGAVEAVLRGAALAAQAGAPLYVVHLNAAGEIDQLQYARQKGLPVMGETCPQYLFFTIDHLRRPDGAKWVCSPPMRTAEDNARLWQGLSDGTIQTIGTDHCPFFFDGTQPIRYEDELVAIPGKELGKENFTLIPNGLPAVQDRLPVLWTYGVRAGRISPNQFVALTSTNPAKIFGLYPRKGALLPGSDADLVIWDPERRLTYGWLMPTTAPITTCSRTGSWWLPGEGLLRVLIVEGAPGLESRNGQVPRPVAGRCGPLRQALSAVLIISRYCSCLYPAYHPVYPPCQAGFPLSLAAGAGRAVLALPLVLLG